MKGLLIDTAGPVVGVAAFIDETCVFSESSAIVSGADGWLTPSVGRALATLGGLDRVGVATGPGAFTGLRVGVATALGLAFARGVPLACLSSLALRAALVPGEARVLSLLDAKKGRVYAGLFDTRSGVERLDPEVDAAPGIVAAVAPAVAVGEGARVYQVLLLGAGHRLAEDLGRSPVAVGASLLWNAAPHAPSEVALRYLREPDAVPRAL